MDPAAARVLLHAATCALLLTLVLCFAGCDSKPQTVSGPIATPAPSAVPSTEQRDSGAMTDLIASKKWSTPSCRWLKTGAWVLAHEQETALYRAAYDSGFIEMEEVGRDNRTGTPEPAWRISLTAAGDAEAAECPPSSKPEVWGIPVSRRQLISGKYVSEDSGFGQRTTYEVEYQWTPTEVGEQVKDVLAHEMMVEEGVYRTRVYLLRGPDFNEVGPNGWYVDQVADVDAVRVR